MGYFEKIDKSLCTAQRQFEENILESFARIIKTRDDLIVNRKIKRPNRTFSLIYTVSYGKTEICQLTYTRGELRCWDTVTLTINGKPQKWYRESLMEMYGMVDYAWRAAKYYAENKDKIEEFRREQDEISLFLSGFLPKQK